MKVSGSLTRTPSGPVESGVARPSAATHDRLRAERDRFLGFAFASGSVLIEVGPDARIGFAAGAVQTFLKEAADRLVGRSLVDFVAPADRGALSLALFQLSARARLLPLALRLDPDLASGRSVVVAGCRLPGAGRVIHLSLRPTAPGEVVPDRDAQSGLLDRNALTNAVHTRLQRGGSGGQKLSFLDLEGLGALHDRLDPAAAERLPLTIGNILHGASSDGTCAKVAGERFGLIHEPELALADVEQELADALRHADPLGEGVVPSSVTLPLDVEGLSESDATKAVSFVIRRFAEGCITDGVPLTSLRDGFDTMLAETVSRLVDYRDELADDRLQLAFQPIVRIADERIHHYEVLSRTRDDPSPARLVHFAEAMDLVDELDLAVCRRAIATLEAATPSLALAVNLSGRSLENSIFIKALLELLDRAKEGVRDRLSFELTETAEVRDLAAVDEVIQTIRQRGCEVGLDDFGTGAATFHYLRSFDIDFVKIDGSLIRSARPRDKAIIKSVVGLCQALDIPTVAEMVETRGQIEWLARLGVTYGQGYMFGRPSSHLVHLRGAAAAPSSRSRPRSPGGRRASPPGSHGGHAVTVSEEGGRPSRGHGLTKR